MKTSWNQRCTNERERVETHRDEQREGYEDRVEFFARLARNSGRFNAHGADGGLGRPNAFDAVDDDEGSW